VLRWPRADELPVVAWSAATFGAVLASYSAFRPLRDTLVGDNAPDQITWLFAATFVLTCLIAPVWGAVVARAPRRVVPAAVIALAKR
jgi:AAA family ATP:ADP antiporter